RESRHSRSSDLQLKTGTITETRPESQTVHADFRSGTGEPMLSRIPRCCMSEWDAVSKLLLPSAPPRNQLTGRGNPGLRVARYLAKNICQYVKVAFVAIAVAGSFSMPVQESNPVARFDLMQQLQCASPRCLAR